MLPSPASGRGTKNEPLSLWERVGVRGELCLLLVISAKLSSRGRLIVPPPGRLSPKSGLRRHSHDVHVDPASNGEDTVLDYAYPRRPSFSKAIPCPSPRTRRRNTPLK